MIKLNLKYISSFERSRKRLTILIDQKRHYYVSTHLKIHKYNFCYTFKCREDYHTCNCDCCSIGECFVFELCGIPEQIEHEIKFTIIESSNVYNITWIGAGKHIFPVYSEIFSVYRTAIQLNNPYLG